MNRRQSLILLSFSVLIALFVTLPPYQQAIVRDGVTTNINFLGYSSLVTPPSPEDGSFARIDYQRLFLQIGAACALGFGLYHTARDAE